jgi:hypothetical protein
MDSMDQEKCALPHFARPSKILEDSSLVKMHVTMAKVNGQSVHEFLYTNNFPHDANTTVTILFR